MNENLMKISIFILLVLPFLGCGSMLCTKGDTKQGLFFEFDSMLGKNYVDIGAEPTATSDSSWVKILMVEYDGFLLVTSQKSVHCDNKEQMDQEAKKGKIIGCQGHRLVENYLIRRYTDEKGYEEWGYNNIPEKEWRGIKNLKHSFSKKPDYHYENCRYHIFGSLYQILQIIDRV